MRCNVVKTKKGRGNARPFFMPFLVADPSGFALTPRG